MAETYLAQSPLAHLGLAQRAAADAGRAAGAGVLVCERAPRGQIALRGDAADAAFMEAVAAVLGFVPPVDPTTAAGGAAFPRLLWLGPDEWLAVTEDGEAAETAKALGSALAGRHAQALDVSDARAVIGLGGPAARDVLAKGCTLDLHPRVFGAGRVARTLLARAPVILHQLVDTPEYDLYVARSYADYLWAWLEDAGAEFGAAVVAG